MPETRKRRQPKRFDIHRTLPNPNDRHKVARTRPDELNIRPEDEIESKAKKRRARWKKALLIVFLILFVPLLIIGGWDYRNFARASQKMFGSNYLLSALPLNNLDSEDGRTNILLTGFSADDPGHAGAELTDSIMILSLDKDSKTGYMLSIPRDLYVEIPGLGYRKINEAYQYGKKSGFKEKGYPKGGMGLLEKIISEDFDIKMHYFVLINYGAVKDTVEALDGITVTIDSNDPRGIYDPGFLAKEGGRVKLKNGQQEIDAQTALNLTRARGLGHGSYGLSQSDFDRGKNQQAVIKGIKDKITLRLMLDPRKNEPILDAFASNIKTDVGLSNVLPLYRLFNGVPSDKLKSVGLRDEKSKVNLLSSYRTPTGQSALIPSAGTDNYSHIHALIRKLNNQ
jgi:LCP family protein required for cell wall assembly